jgi:hypothetical protein
MFKGNNDLVINQATMLEIVQAWLNKYIITNTPVAIGIKYSHSDYTFTINVKETVDANNQTN